MAEIQNSLPFIACCAQEDHTTKQMLEQFADLAGKKVHVEKRSLVGAQLEAFAAAVRQDDVHVLAISVRQLQAVSCPSVSADMLCNHNLLKLRSSRICLCVYA